MRRQHRIISGISIALIVTLVMVSLVWLGWPGHIESIPANSRTAVHAPTGSSLVFGPVLLSNAAFANCGNTSVGLTPISDLGTGTYNGYQGGQYPNGSNQIPSTYLQTGLSQASQIQPLDRFGNPSSSGKIVLLSIGMSHASLEFSGFIPIANADPQKSSFVQLVNGSQFGETADQIVNPKDPYWRYVTQSISESLSTAYQVQAIWLKEAIDYGYMPQTSFPTDAQNLQTDLQGIVGILEGMFPNLRIIYLSSRSYGGYAVTPLNPDGPPFGMSYYAHDSAFAVKWLIQDRINAITSGSAWLDWGPYLWADGIIPRSDGLQWLCADYVQNDGTHPSASGIAKVAGMLSTFFKSDPTAVSWYLTSAPTPIPTTVATLRPASRR